MISSLDDLPKVALIGVSGYATVYVEWLLEAQKARRLRIVSVNVIPAEQSLPVVEKLRLAGALIFDSYEELFAADAPSIDLCYIPTGIQWHARMAIAALRSGCNVLVEKPLAGSIADVESVQAVEAETGNWVAVGFQDMYTDEISALKSALVAGVIGPITSVSMLGAWPRPESYYQRNHWAGRLFADEAQVLDSPFNNAFAHFLNLSLFLAGEDIDTSADTSIVRSQLYRAHDIESFDTAVVTAKSASGVEFWFGASHACKESLEPAIRIEGKNGHIDWTHENRCATYVNGQLTHDLEVPKYAVTRSKMFESVLERLKSPEARICDSSIAKRHTALIEQIHSNSDIQDVSPSEIERHYLDNRGTCVPAIRNIESMLQSAFENRTSLEGIDCQPASA